MKKKTILRFICLLFVCCLLFSLSANPAAAQAENDEQTETIAVDAGGQALEPEQSTEEAAAETAEPVAAEGTNLPDIPSDGQLSLPAEEDEAAANEPDEPKTQPDVPTSANLNRFLTKTVIDAPKDEKGLYNLEPGKTYAMTLSFAEKEDLHFKRDAALAYEFPDVYAAKDASPKEFSIQLSGPDGTDTISGSNYEVSAGRLIVHLIGSTKLQQAENVSFRVSVSVSSAKDAAREASLRTTEENPQEDAKADNTVKPVDEEDPPKENTQQDEPKKADASESPDQEEEELALGRNLREDAPTSTDLARFLTAVTCNAPVDENGHYIVDPNQAYEITLSFAESESLQFDNVQTLEYQFPSGLLAPDVSGTSFDIRIKDDEGTATVTGNTFSISNGKLSVRFNQSDPNIDRLKAMANVEFKINAGVSFDGSAETIVFSADVEKEFVYESNSDIEITKAVQYNGDTDTASYVLTVKSQGLNENVIIRDQLTGTALIFNQDVQASSSMHGALSIQPDYNSVENGFALTIPRLENGEIITLTYSADVDNTKISSNGTVEQTQNTARVKSDQMPDWKEVSADFAGQADFQRVSKKNAGEPVKIGDTLYEQTWTILVNDDHKLPMGGTYINDWIVQNSRPYMHFTGDGITVKVTFENGQTETRTVSWSELYLWQNDNGIWGWRYMPPETDEKASYEITCKTLINAAGALGELTLINGAQVYGSYDEAQTTIGVIGENVFGIQKEAIGTTSTESEWQITVTVPGSGLPEMHIVDDCPKLDGHTNIDYLIEDSIEVDGLLEGESWRLALSGSGRSFSVYFYKTETQNAANAGVLPTPDGQPRDIVIRFKTQVDQEWLNMAVEDGYASSTYYRHRNYACAWSDTYRTPTVNASVVPYRPLLVKNFVERTDVEIGGVTYPVFRYSLSLSGPMEDGIVLHDSFNTNYLRFYGAEGVGIRGGRRPGNLDNANGTAYATEGADGIDITVSSFPKNSDGYFYPYYLVSYSLIVKDENALNALNRAAAETPGGIDLDNTASWEEFTSSRKVNYTHFPYVDKELVSAATADNDYIAEFKLIINQYAEDLDPASDTLNIQDELSSNLRFIQDSLSISPSAEGMRTRFDSETNTLIFMDVPDNTRFEVTYQARVLGVGNVTYSNTIRMGKYEKTVEEVAEITSSGGGSASNPSITLIKRDAENLSATLAGATFQLFYLQNGIRVPVMDNNGNEVHFTTGADGRALIVGNQNTLGWALWANRTYCLLEISPPIGYEINNEPISFVLKEHPAGQMEYSLTGDTLDVHNERLKTQVTAKKNWIGPAATEAVVYLFADGIQIDSATLTADDEWTHTFADLPMYDVTDGHEIVYTIEEKPIRNYVSERIETEKGSWLVINTNTETITIPVQKVWIGPAAQQVAVQLLADNQQISEITLTAADDWKHTFSGLLKYDQADGHEIVYKVQEPRIEGYESRVTGSAQDGFTITNTNVEKIAIPVQKRWVGPKLNEAVALLLADGVEIDRVTLSDANNWSHEFDGLLKYDATDGHEILYYVGEEVPENYSFDLEGSVETGFTLINKNGEATQVSVRKRWVGPIAGPVVVRLLADKTPIRDMVLSEENNWSFTFAGLPKYGELDGHEIEYTVSEDVPANYECEITGTAAQGYTIVNTAVETIDIPVLKTWIGPAASAVQVTLLADGVRKAEATLTAAVGWSHSFTGLPRFDPTDGHEIEYSVEESSLPDYLSRVTGSAAQGFTITNTASETITIPVQKVWIGPAAREIGVQLLADGTIVREIVLSRANAWKHSFENLPKYSATDGHAIHYTVREVHITGYTTTIQGDQSVGFVIRNVNVKTTSVAIEKRWVGKPLSGATIRLYADGVFIAYAELNAAGNWRYSFTNLPKYDALDGHAIEYTIQEDSIYKYSCQITGNAASGFVVTNTQKERHDPKSPAPKTGDSALIGLYAGLLLLSAIMLAAILMHGRKRKQR